MCGLFGWFKYKDPLTESEFHQARRAVKSLQHRGPDSEGEWHDNRVFMGHRRLKVIDLSDNAAQPFQCRDNRYILTYNGEIYNYIELRKELVHRGETFRSESDTEVFLAAYKHWGENAFRKFDGMFAAAIHDTMTDTHCLVRDHLGQKPLYYHAHTNGVVYGSELRSLLGLDSFSWRIDRLSFMRFLMNSYYVWDNTPLENVYKLLPGCFLKIQAGKTRLVRYWDSLPGQNMLDIGPVEAVDEFERLFDRSCKQSLRSDVSYGVFLSGGVDSSLVLSSCKKYNPDVTCFSVAMSEKDYDESGKADLVGRHLNVKTHHIYELNQNGLSLVLKDFLNTLDEPHGDPGYVNQLFLARSCREDITVAIAGDGGDELFSGYEPFRGLILVPLMNLLPDPVVSNAKDLVERILPGTDSYLGLQFKILAYLQGFPAEEMIRYPLWLSSISPELSKRLCINYPAGFFDRFGTGDSVFDYSKNLLSDTRKNSPQQQLLYFYQKVFLPEFVCMHTDRAAMQTSLEVRSPFLSVPLIEFVNRLPDAFKAAGHELKRLPKHLMKKRGFPRTIVNQRKQGFTFPIARWLKYELRHHLESMLHTPDFCDDLVNVNVLEDIKQSHLTGKQNFYRVLFNLLTFKAWRKNFPSVTAN